MDQPQPTPRQIRMISLCACGYSREEIGRELIVSPWTVKMDLDQLRGMLGARNLPHAVAICVRAGYIKVDSAEMASPAPPRAVIVKARMRTGQPVAA